MNFPKLSPGVKAWVHSIAAGFIGGGASAGAAFALSHGNCDFKQLGSVFLMAGLTTALGLLAKSPLP